ncbi:hypothetical protein [Schlesneria paludicola]|uniref:hypothetical protein n=1 Tax=Schlesneria paludicola TaxID=360056 RepID=UPI00058B94D8|nr:hypothetical protein [Schlesneria paludicola]
MATTRQTRPSWYTKDDDTAWERVKDAFKRDWKQTKYDFGAEAPNLKQNVGDTLSQAAGSEPIPPENVPNAKPAERDRDTSSDVYRDDDDLAYRYGYAAYRHYGSTCCDWNMETEDKLRKEWGDSTEWPERKNAIRRGWFFAKNNPSSSH